MPLNWRSVFAFVHDLAACTAAWFAAFWLRLNPDVPDYFLALAWQALPWLLCLHGILFLGFGLYRGRWRFASLPDLRRILLATGVAAAALPALLFMLQLSVPRSVLIMSPVILVMIMGGNRLAYRAWKEKRLAALVSPQREPVFIIGATGAAANLIRELSRSPQWQAVGIFDDDKAMRGSELLGVKVLGGLDQLSLWKNKLSVAQAIIAMPESSHATRRFAVETCNTAGLQVMTVPSFDDLISGKVTVSQIRHVELDDLLGRDPVTLDIEGLRGWIAGKVIMVTGAGGSIGSELCRQIARFNPRQLILFELNEFAMYSIEQEFANLQAPLDVICAIGDVKDSTRVDDLLRRFRPNVIFHAAAYKHVPLMENQNAWQAVLNNVKGTHVVARSSIDHGIEKFVLISTDKAVNPANVMGASKRLAEMICQAMQPATGTRFLMVRFGNVLGSTGSVIPKFREQIANGGPVTVTHPEITRYFMSIPEAVQLVLQAGLMGQGGEIFVLDMGEPVKIADLARDMIRLSGLSESEIRIVYTGLRPGEKLYEELLAADENTLPTPHAKLRIARARTESPSWASALSEWLTTGAPADDSAVRQELVKWVPEYRSQ